MHEEIKNPFALNYEVNVDNIKPRFKFDENGVIIEDNSNIIENKKPLYEFDENGFIIADNTVNNNHVSNEIFDKVENKKVEVDLNSKFKFDEDGLIIEE